MDLFSVAMLAVLAVLIFFMFRNSRKRKADQEQLRSQIVPGAEVMTNFGLYGTLVSMDEVTKVAELEVAPGNVVRVHSQTIAKVVSADEGEPGEPRSVEEAMEIANREAEERDRAGVPGASISESSVNRASVNEASVNEDSAIPLADPEYGERVDATKKPARRTTKKVAE